MRVTRDFIFDPSLVLYLPLSELDGASFRSKDTYGHLATVTGALWGPQGYSLDGVDDKIVIPDHSALKLGTSDFTLEAWFKTSKTSTNQVVFKKRDGGTYWYTFYIMSGSASLKLELSGVDSASDTGSVATGNWMHCVMVRDYAGNTCTFYKNSVSSIGTISGSLQRDVTNTASVVIGSYDGSGELLEGIISEVRIYNRALTPLEILHNYQATKWRYQ